ncbi:MAG: hypothetical protein AMXMBFR13_16420 [Phycisphaerae bacterium]
MTMSPPIAVLPGNEALIRRVNQLYHDFTRGQFDGEHRHRHRVEGAFWRHVGARAVALLRADRAAGRSASASPALTVLDLACGTGLVTCTLGAMLKPQDRLIAADLAAGTLENLIDKWRQTGAAAAHLPLLSRLNSDAQELPLASASIDLVVMNAALHHVPRPAVALAEINRVLKPGGLFALGFEPNRTHFECRTMCRLSRGMDLLSWYGSWEQNRRRLRQWLTRANGHGGSKLEAAELPQQAINARLQECGLIHAPLEASQLLDLVDPHARGAGQSAGFEPDHLLRDALPGYELLMLRTSDYLGQSSRRLPLLRAATDGLARLCMPRHGLLFSWLVRKPAVDVRPQAVE